ncbi:MAG: hypothetical protein JWL59_2384 [Chthoniobacteraceae bacterium]|nr:hypothetical protein [Chthoniobacteraceae bacterium]
MASKTGLLIRFRFVLILVALILGPANAQQDDDWNIQFEHQIVALPEPIARSLIKDLLDGKKSEAAHARLQALIIEGKAALTAWSTIKVKSGQNATISVLTEDYYVSEYEDLHMASHVTESADLVANTYGGLTLELTTFDRAPAKIESAKLGLELNARATVYKNGELIDVALTSKHVRKKEFSLEAPAAVEKLAFTRMENNGHFYIRNKQWILTGIHKSSEPQIQIQLLRVEAIKMH